MCYFKNREHDQIQNVHTTYSKQCDRYVIEIFCHMQWQIINLDH